MGYQFEVTDEKDKPILSIRNRTSVANLPAELGKAYGAILQYLGEIGETTEGPAFAEYYNLDMEDLDVEMGFLVPKPINGRGEIMSGVIPAGRQASYLYKGPYTEMEPVYNAMTEWMAAEGLEPTGICYELYYTGPEVPQSDQLTKIVFPLK